MRLAKVEPGTFRMGADDGRLPDELTDGRPHLMYGDHDERPAHDVEITQAFHIGVVQVTNAQYEEYDPDHRQCRGRLGFSVEDDEAVVFVTWYDAMEFCRWLSEKEGKTYRLPTEAEWEYACRGGTRTPFHTGNALPEPFLKNARQSWFPDAARGEGNAEVVPLRVGLTPVNPWGLFDMHGNVEEWCHDWYGLYGAERQSDPAGPAAGDFRVTRGGSHSTLPFYLRSANRSAALPEDCTWLIGFRVVMGEGAATKPLPVEGRRRWQVEVRQEPPTPTGSVDAPVFLEPRVYVDLPADASGPLFHNHNHDTALASCPNGDLLALWYSCVTEQGRELVVAASRLRNRQTTWEEADLFWGAPDRNNHAPALWFDGEGTLYHFNGMSAAATWGPLATVLRTSDDSGVTWSTARLIMPEHKNRQMPVQTVFRAKDGTIVLPCDAVTVGRGGTALWLSRDNGETWTDPGGTIAGIHGAVVQLADGSLMALGRGDSIHGRMPMSLSSDMGETWRYLASPFPPVSSGQRCVLLRLQEGPILLVSFTEGRKEMTTMPIADASGQEREVTGLYAALTLDEGKTWPCRRLVSDDGPGRELETMDGRPFTMGFESAEPGGYLSVCQGADGLVHLISSRLHYSFNLAWLKATPPSTPAQ